MTRRQERTGRDDGPREVARTSAIFGLLVLLSALLPCDVRGQDETGGAVPGSDGLELSGGIYLYHYAPVDLEGAEAETEVYALYLDLDRSWEAFDLHVQGRWRDTRLRDFFPSNVWIQEAWVAWRPDLGRGESREGNGEPKGDRPRGRGDEAVPDLEATVRAGKLYQRLGRFWDGSFFGNVHYFDGLKLDPELGVEGEAAVPWGDEGARLTLHGQVLVDSDRVNGALPGRDLEGEAGAAERGASLGGRIALPAGRIAGRPLRLTAGISGLFESVELESISSEGEASSSPRTTRLDHLAVETEVAWGPVVSYGEWIRRSVEDGGAASGEIAGSRADYGLVGLQVDLGPMSLRYNYSSAAYEDAGFTDHIHQPGLTLALGPGVSVLLEYDDWRRARDDAPADGAPTPDGDASTGGRSTRVDRSLNAVLLLTL